MRRIPAQSSVAHEPLWQAVEDLHLGMAPGMVSALQVHMLPERVRWVRA